MLSARGDHSDSRRREVERVELGLAHVGLSEADVRRLRAMLMLALADGSLRAQWNFVAAKHARVIILGVESIDQMEAFSQGNRIVSVLVGAADHVPPGTRTLSWPIRAEDLLELLQQAETLEVSNASTSSCSRSLIQLAELLRRSSQDTPRNEVWRVTGLSRTPIYIAPHHRQFFCTESLRTVHRFDVRDEIDLIQVPIGELPVLQEQPKPIVMLQWSIGLLTGAVGLLPWLKTSATMRLQRFPEFQILHHEPAHRRLAAAFSRPIAGIDAAVELTRLDKQTVYGFVNGADLCGYLRTSDQSGAVARLPVRTVVGTKRTLAQLLRRALGIETTDA
jgi:hypothetical protein